jgi:hypothetical protein
VHFEWLEENMKALVPHSGLQMLVPQNSPIYQQSFAIITEEDGFTCKPLTVRYNRGRLRRNLKMRDERRIHSNITGKPSVNFGLAGEPQ